MMWISIALVLLLAVVTIVFVNQPSFGKLPSGVRLERIKRSPNFKNGTFVNLSPTQQITSDKSKAALLLGFAFRKVKDLRPAKPLPAVKTSLASLKREEDVMVWLGHSSLFLQMNGTRLLVDPVLVSASPVSFLNKPFKGTNIFSPEDIPDVDYLLLTHDHWDHLDYQTLKQLKSRIGKVICPLGVGEHLEYWGFDKSRIIEMDWNESKAMDNGLVIHCLPARHFSGRGIFSNKTLWVSYMLQSPSGNIYLSGDTGYDTHFAAIARQFPQIDLAVLENGQYNEEWKYIHLMPGDLVQAMKELKAARNFTVHNSKFALGKHAWYEPLVNISAAAESDLLNLLTPEIGEPLYWKDSTQKFNKWWEKMID